MTAFWQLRMCVRSSSLWHPRFAGQCHEGAQVASARDVRLHAGSLRPLISDGASACSLGIATVTRTSLALVDSSQTSLVHTRMLDYDKQGLTSTVATA